MSPRRKQPRTDTTDADQADTAPTVANDETPSAQPAADAIAAGDPPVAPEVEPTPRTLDTEPAYITAEWWPANILLPDGRTLTDVRVYATDLGLIVYDRPGHEVFRSAIDYTTAPRPTGDPITSGNQVQTADGIVYVALTIVQCASCGNSTGLRNWTPAYAGSIVPWGPTGEPA